MLPVLLAAANLRYLLLAGSASLVSADDGGDARHQWRGQLGNGRCRLVGRSPMDLATKEIHIGPYLLITD
ncbi:hypothetical protein BDB13_4207 [Rhodococcus sp. OK302]|nr:hypothetical protein BDB13_4207 [Rhodococcus sp. OK302]